MFDDQSRKRISRAVQKVERANPNNQPKRKQWPGIAASKPPMRLLTVYSDAVAQSMEFRTDGVDPFVPPPNSGMPTQIAGDKHDIEHGGYLSTTPDGETLAFGIDCIVQVEVSILARHDVDSRLYNASHALWVSSRDILREASQNITFPHEDDWEDQSVLIQSSLKVQLSTRDLVTGIKVVASASGTTEFEAFGTVLVIPQ